MGLHWKFIAKILMQSKKENKSQKLYRYILLINKPFAVLGTFCSKYSTVYYTPTTVCWTGWRFTGWFISYPYVLTKCNYLSQQQLNYATRITVIGYKSLLIYYTFLPLIATGNIKILMGILLAYKTTIFCALFSLLSFCHCIKSIISWRK